MRAIFRSPTWEVLLGALTQPWLAGCGSGGWGVLLVGLALMLVVCVSFAAIAWTHGGFLALCERLRRLRAGYRFLCPHCFCFGAHRYACTVCGREVEGFVVRTRGRYVNDCPHCKTWIFSRGSMPERGVVSYCGECRSVSPLYHHARQIRVLGAFGAEDVASFCEATPGTWVRRSESAVRDDGKRLTYIVNMEAVGACPSPRAHAVHRLETLWLDRAAGEPLALGMAVDRFLRSSGLSLRRGRKPVVRSPRGDLDPVSRRLVETRLGRIRRAVQLGMLESRG